MIKQTFKFQDLDGNDVEEEYYFALSLSEIAKLEVGHSDGLEDYLKQIVASKDGTEIITAMENIVALSVGKRSENGRFVEKTPAIAQSFMQSGAYDEFFLSLVTDAGASAAFVKGIVPSDMAKRVEAASAKSENKKEYTDVELLSMTQSEFDAVVGTDPLKMERRHLNLAFRRKGQMSTPAYTQ
jgi:hypothetical protein